MCSIADARGTLPRQGLLASNQPIWPQRVFTPFHINPLLCLLGHHYGFLHSVAC